MQGGKQVQEKTESANDGGDSAKISLHVLDDYLGLKDPISNIIKYSLVLIVITCSLYVLLGFIVPAYPDAVYQIVQFYVADRELFDRIVANYLTVPLASRWDRLVLLVYLSLYAGMWWAYFKSKISMDPPIEAKRLKIQTLRRLLGTTSSHWKPKIEPEVDKEIIQYFRDKGNASMSVIAILVAASVLIFDQISSIWSMEDASFTLWQYAVLWAGMLAAVTSFVCFMLCVDALDTMHNRFQNDDVRSTLVHYFYTYTINPRYVAVASMLLSMVLLLAYHSEVLASLSIAIILWVGYQFWFPDIRGSAAERGVDMAIMMPRRHKGWHVVLLISLPLAISALAKLYA